jgi:acetyl-CoA acetyltransferase
MASNGNGSGDNVWILGAHMTKFTRYKDRDMIDLASEASMAALDDGGVTIHDMDVMGAGNLMEAASGVGPPTWAWPSASSRWARPVCSVRRRVPTRRCSSRLVATER